MAIMGKLIFLATDNTDKKETGKARWTHKFTVHIVQPVLFRQSIKNLPFVNHFSKLPEILHFEIVSQIASILQQFLFLYLEFLQSCF